MKDLYERLQQKDKPNKVALFAVMRKLLVLAYGVLKSDKPFILAIKDKRQALGLLLTTVYGHRHLLPVPQSNDNITYHCFINTSELGAAPQLKAKTCFNNKIRVDFKTVSYYSFHRYVKQGIYSADWGADYESNFDFNKLHNLE